MQPMITSNDGIEFIERHEGVVLKTYIDAVGVRTIGAGLTKASGVIDPKPGMTITRKQASALLAQALANNYEPAVRKAMPGAKQHEFDGAVSFHFNTGAIHRASWVGSWLGGNWPEVSRRIRLWKKGGGRVLPGLVRRRGEEFNLIRHGDYGHAVKSVNNVLLARVVVSITHDEMREIRAALKGLGYNVGNDASGVAVGAVAKFQADHDLTVDAIIGKATLSTLQRRLDAKSKAKATTATSTTSAATTVGSGATEVVPANLSLWLTIGVVGVAVLFALYLAWTYRDVVAAKIQHRLPGLARKLRSI